MKTLLLKADSALEKAGRWGLLVSGILILVMGLLTTYGVGRRYILDSPEPYSYELAVIFLVACTLLAMPFVQYKRRNIRVDFIVNHMSPRWQLIFEDIITPVLGLSYVAIVVWKSWEIFVRSVQVHETSQSAWQEPLWPMKLLVVVTFVWLGFVLISQLGHGIDHLVKGTTREDTRIKL